jgi:hypothetical protein
MEVIRELRCVQLDPTNAVAQTQMLVPWSRIGSYDTALLEDLLWKEKKRLPLLGAWGFVGAYRGLSDSPAPDAYISYGRRAMGSPNARVGR